jgi:hypothetical protein
MAILVVFTQNFNCNSPKWYIGYAKLVGAGDSRAFQGPDPGGTPNAIV